MSHLRNEEHIYLVARPSLLDRIPDALDRLRALTFTLSQPAAARPASTSAIR